MALFSRRHERDTTDVDVAEPSRVASGQTGPVSRPVPAITGPTPIVELHDSLLHTATPRYIAALGLLATLVTAVSATLPSFEDVGVLHMRLRVDEALLISAGVMAFGCMWWSTFATANGRRVTRDRTIGPILPMFVYIAIAVACLALNATVHGEARPWGWLALALVAFTAHWLIMVTFKSSAEAIGDLTSHFTQVAIIPIAMAAAVALGFAVGMLGVALLLVMVLMAWMAVEMFRAMRGWDRACEQRMKVMLRDFTYDTPSGSVPAVAPTNTGQTSTTPQRTQVLQVTTTEPPARAPGSHHPVRPTWNPVEEARQKAQQQAAMAMGAAPAGAGGQSALDAYMEGVAGPRPVQTQRRRHHTLIPKLLATLSVATPFLLYATIWWLFRQGHVELIDWELLYDDTARRAIVLAPGLVVLFNVVGWMWWATASLANARLRSASAPRPGIVPTTYWAFVGGVVLFVVGFGVDVAIISVVGFLILFVAAIYGYFGVLSALRKAAGVIGAPKEPWTTLIWLPLYGFLVGLVIGAAQRATDSPVVDWVAVALNTGLNIWQVVTFLRAMWSFDRVSRMPPAPKVDEAHVPLYLRHAMGAR